MMNNKYKILFVEDDSNIRSVVSTLLETEGYQVIWAGTCQLAQGLFTSHQPDVVILDLGLPDMDGMHFLEFVRRDSLTPIIVLSARSNDRDKVNALDAGANDYLPKPFDVRELLARVRVLTRAQTQQTAQMQWGDLCLDTVHFTLMGPKGQQALNNKEYQTFLLLMQTPGAPVSVERILQQVWEPDCDP